MTGERRSVLKDNKVIARSVLMVIVVLVVFFGMANTENTYAKSAKWKIIDEKGKVGKYYFRWKRNYDEGVEKWQYSKSKKRGYKDLHEPMEDVDRRIVTNGKKAYLFAVVGNRFVVYSTKIGSGKLKKCKTKKCKYPDFYPEQVYGNCILLWYFDDGLIYNKKTNKLSSIKNYWYQGGKGKYFVLSKDTENSKCVLFKIHKGKLKRVKLLTSKGEALANGGIICYTKRGKRKTGLYSCKINGSKPKRLVIINHPKGKAPHLEYFSDDGKEIWFKKPPYLYGYNFKTKKVKKVFCP